MKLYFIKCNKKYKIQIDKNKIKNDNIKYMKN